jgi:hypothetical protein
MADTVNLPELGKTKKVYVYGAAGAVVLVVGIAYVRRSRASSAAASSAAATGTAVDPETGFPEGSAADLQALAALGTTDDTGFADTSGGSIGPGVSSAQLFYDPADGLYDLTSPYVPPTGGGTSTAGASNTGPGTFTDNAYWTQYAISNVTGYTAAQIQGAIAAVMAGQALTTTQLTIWQQCTAVAGSPPTPPSTAPHLAAQAAAGGNSSSHPAPGGISTTPGPNYIDVGISPVPGAADLYHYQALTAAGALASDTIVAKTSARLTGLTGKTKYLVRVSADPDGLWSAERAVTTT